MHESPWTLAVCCRGPNVAIAVFSGVTFMDLTQHRLQYPYRALATTVVDVAVRVGAEFVICEPASPLDQRRRTLGLATQTLTVAGAKDVLLPGRTRCSNEDLFRYIVEVVPCLRQVVQRGQDGEVLRVQKWNAPALSAVALGLAAARSRHARQGHITM